MRSIVAGVSMQEGKNGLLVPINRIQRAMKNKKIMIAMATLDTHLLICKKDRVATTKHISAHFMYTAFCNIPNSSKDGDSAFRRQTFSTASDAHAVNIKMVRKPWTDLFCTRYMTKEINRIP